LEIDMENKMSGNLLKATRAAIWVSAILLAMVAAGILLGAVLIPLRWDALVAFVGRERPEVDFAGIMPALYTLLTLTLVTIGLAWAILRKLLAIVATVSEGDPFVHANAARLKAIGWLMVTAQVIGLPLVGALRMVTQEFGRRASEGYISLTALLAILLVFVLAGVFEQGAAMREDIEGTV
jgi:hypothetical protein